MDRELLALLRCPHTGQRLALESSDGGGARVETGVLVTEDGRRRYPIRNAIPRFAPESNYADNFGMQWNQFRKTQLDSHSGHPISADRFWQSTGWRPEDVAGRWVLDAGCGAGRFAEVVLQAGGRVVALDYSSAVDACYANLAHHPGLHVVQGDIYALPFAKGAFPFVYSLGVLQHTPDVAKAVASLPAMVASGGRLCVDFYPKSWRTTLHPKYWLRPLTTRVPKRHLFAICETWVPRLLVLSQLLASVPVLGVALKRLVPVANYSGVLPLSDRQQQEWSLLDTFDWFSPEFDHPQTATTARRWFESAGLEQIEVFARGFLVARGVSRAPSLASGGSAK